MYSVTVADEEKRIQFFKDLESNVRNLKGFDQLSKSEESAINNFSQGVITLNTLKEKFQQSNDDVSRLKDRFNEIDRKYYAEPSARNYLMGSALDDANIPKRFKQTFKDYADNKISGTNFNKSIEFELQKKEERVLEIQASFDKNITTPALDKIYSAEVNGALDRNQIEALSSKARGLSYGSLNDNGMANSTKDKTDLYNEMYSDLHSLQKKSPSESYKDKITGLKDAPAPVPANSSQFKQDGPKPASSNQQKLDGPKPSM